MHWLGLYLACLFSPNIFLPALAVFSDEVYHIDYHHALFGVPQPHNTFFHRPSAHSKGSLLYSLSENGILGAINPKDGSIVWRQSLWGTDRPGAHKGLLRATAEGNTVFSAVNGALQAWDAAEGRLVWEQSYAGDATDLKVLDFGNASKGYLVLATESAATGTVTKLAADSGKILWEFQDER